MSSTQAVQTQTKREPSVIGKPLKRMEDPKFITGSGRFMDDINLPNTLHAVFVRSLQAHAKIVRFDLESARKAPGVRLALSGKDIVDELEEMPTVPSWSKKSKATHSRALAADEVNFAGEPVAVVVADTVAQAEDAAELVEVEYDPLPVVSDMEKALEEGSPKVHEYLPDNLGFYQEYSSGNIKKAFRSADRTVELTLEFPRLSATPLEPRDIVASFDKANDFLTAYVSCQSPHEVKQELAERLRLPETKVRLIAPDMGGGFGQKGFFGEHAVVSLASMKLGRPVKWVESRRENLMSATHGRGQKQYVSVAVRKDGKILGLKVKVICDGGAYSDWSTSMPDTTVAMSCGVYDVGAFYGEAMTAFTNKTQIGAYRGASRPEAAYLIERTIDTIARQLKLDPVKVRLKNYVPKSKFPFKSVGGLTYDSGDYEGNMSKALEYAKYEDMRTYQREARARGRLVGIGVITYVEVCGFGPGYPQTAAVTVTRNGSVIVNSGTNPHGQGHWTPFAQIVSEELGVEPNDVAVLFGDTAALPWNSITAGSRSAVVGGTAVLLATRKVRDKMGRIAAKMMGVRSEQMLFRDGKVISPTTGKSVVFEEVAEKAYEPDELPTGMEATLYEYCAYAPPDNVFPFGTHLAMVDVDRETGKVKILKYVAVDDVGKVLNPLIVEGQVQGGALQGISQALLEEIVYDENGQLLTATLSDYLIPSTDTAPTIECYRTETPSPNNPLGLKGVGEAGTIAATPVIANAVEDALTPYHAFVEKLPLTPSYVWSLMKGRESR
ncbi:MAG TPA: xanthine dehydrogenase family protein molybdopterin-binding subunit [Nitrososphaerales archaeon]|nr:xanthine dehydrogenase family protein molybdopterin-binding subunit [Nitrososphaerales archaeon]